MTEKRPGGKFSTRPLHFIWICDCSGSMSTHGKIQALNNAIRQVIPLMQNVADNNPNIQLLVRALQFSNGAQWLIEQSTPIEQFEWIDLLADGLTDMGKAFSLIAEQLTIEAIGDRALAPVLILISDGQPTDDFNAGLQVLMKQPWGQKAVRLAIAMGQDADHGVLQKFIGNPELKVFSANNADSLLHYIKWASTVGIQNSSQISIPHENAFGSPTLRVPGFPKTVTEAPDSW
jgi:uncharacterized protein YegL